MEDPQVVGRILLTASVLFLSVLSHGGDYGEKGTHGGRVYCYLILKKLAGGKLGTIGRLEAFAKIQKTEYLEKPPTEVINENPTSVVFGLRFTIPLWDPKEKIDRLRDYLNRLNSARKLLSDYLTLRREIEAWEKYLLWRKKRVCYGVEYLTNLWRDAIDIEAKKEELKTYEVEFCSLGIPRKWLDLCYFATIKELPKYTFPVEVPQCNATTR